MENGETWKQWAARIAPKLKPLGLTPITLDKLGRLDRLYAEVNSWGFGWDEGPSLKDASPGELPDGRIALIAPNFGIAEPKCPGCGEVRHSPHVTCSWGLDVRARTGGVVA